MLWHEHVRRGVKVAALTVLHCSGALHLLRRFRTRDCAVILMYHRVSPRDAGVPDYSPTGMTVTPEEFLMQMRFLRRHYRIVPLREIVQLLGRGVQIPSGTCAVTFDDGWRDVYEYAFPVLKTLDIPTTMFLTTAYVEGSGWNPEERVRYLLARIHRMRTHAEKSPASRALFARLESIGLDGILRVSRSRMPGFVLRAVRALRATGGEHRSEALRILEDVAAQLDPDEPRPFLNWEEVREMAQAGMQLGNHTLSHPVLPDLPDDEILHQIRCAREVIRLRTGVDAADFAYPFGKFEPRVEALVSRSGSVSACTTHIGPVRAGARIHALNRVNICSEVSSNVPMFAARLIYI
jgi:peptidoglycan/xylan/chitin deacetylase (PgdA/CDA1 family)